MLLGLQTFHPFAYCPSWGQVGIKPRDEAAIKALAKTIKVDGKEATLVLHYVR